MIDDGTSSLEIMGPLDFAADLPPSPLEHPVYGEHCPPPPNQLLYHYTPVQTLLHIRKSGGLLMSPLSKMNDPQEAMDVAPTRVAFPAMGNESGPASSVEQRQLADPDKVERELDWLSEINSQRQALRVACFVRDQAVDFTGVGHHDNAEMSRRLHAVRGFCHPRMWAQYANSHAGVCIVFNRMSLETRFRELQEREGAAGVFGDVSYMEPHEPIGLGPIDLRTYATLGAEGLFAQNTRRMLLSKHNDWRHENEARAILQDNSDYPRIFPIEACDVSGLVVGPKFDTANNPVIDAFTSRYEVEMVCQLSWVSGLPTLHAIPDEDESRGEN